MNRPNVKDDPNYPFEFPNTYLGNLEEYCDYLEHKIEMYRLMFWDIFLDYDKYDEAINKFEKGE